MDPIADMFSQIKNAGAVRSASLIISYSKLKTAILDVLKKHHQIAGFNILENDGKNAKKNFKQIEIKLAEESPTDINKISRPGRRVYASSKDIPRPKRAGTLIIVSTSQGILEGEAARRKGLGGEVLAEVR